jgi:hypothetical protein
MKSSSRAGGAPFVLSLRRHDPDQVLRVLALQLHDLSRTNRRPSEAPQCRLVEITVNARNWGLLKIGSCQTTNDGQLQSREVGVIVSTRHKFIFVHIPKTAGSSITSALKPYGKDNKLAKATTKHETLPEFFARNHVAPNQFFKFGFVRNPWCRVVSFYFYLRKRAYKIPEINGVDDFTAFLRILDQDAPWLKKKHSVRPQSDFIFQDGKLIADFVGRYEKLDEDYATACAKIGIHMPSLDRINRSEHTHYARYYNDWGRDFIAERYKRDIANLGYAFCQSDQA